jgi:hypothetical protein
MKRELTWRETALAGVAGVVLAVLMTWPLALHLGSDIGKDLGDPMLEAWQIAWIGHALSHAPLDLWQSNTFWPYEDTLAFTDALLGYAPVGLLSQASPHAALVGYNALFLFAYALAFVGAYLLARELGIGWIGASAAGAAFAYAPWKLAQNGHLHVLSSGGIPLALFLLLRGYRRGSVATVIAGWLVATWQMTLGFTLGLQFAYLVGVLAVVAVVGMRRGWLPRPDRGVLVATVVGAVLFAVASGLLARPYLRVIDAHPESKRTPAYVDGFSPRRGAFLAAPAESWLWDDATKRVRDNLVAPWESSFFPGLAVSCLVLVGLLGSVLSRRLRIGLGLAVVVCALLSLGVRDVDGPRRYLTPYRLLYDFAPGWDGVRTPGRINTLTSLGLALLAGAGLCVIVGVLRRRGRVAIGTAAGLVGVATILVEGVGPLTHVAVPPPSAAVRHEAAPQLNVPAVFHADLRYSYWSTAGFPETVNGAGAIDPTAYDHLRHQLADFPDRKTVRALRRLGVKTVIFHPSLVPEFGGEGTDTRPIAGLGIERERVGDVVVFRLH